MLQFGLPNFSEEEKTRIRESDCVLMPVLVDKDSVVMTLHDGDSGSAPPTERKMAFLVYL